MTAHLNMLLAFYNAIVLATVALALRKGDEPEQLASLVIMTALFADWINHWLLGAPNFFTINPGHLVLDGWQLIVLMWVALYANRGWPLWVAALQMIVVAGHLSKLFDVAEIRRGYWVMIAVPGYLQLVVVWIGLASHMRRVGRIGPYAAWRPRLPEPPRLAPTDDRQNAGQNARVRTGS